MQIVETVSNLEANMSDCKCRNCLCDHHCGAECIECTNDVCTTCDCEHCVPSNYAHPVQEWSWADSGIEHGI
jgi:hypothetical protein